MTLHPLVEKIRWMPRRTEFSLEDLGNVDKIIRGYLESKSGEIVEWKNLWNEPRDNPKSLYDILDLSPKEEKIDEIQAEFSDGSTGDTLKRKLNELIRAVNELRSK